MTALEVREKAASLVERYAAPMGMDQFAADQLVKVIRAIPVDDETGSDQCQR